MGSEFSCPQCGFPTFQHDCIWETSPTGGDGSFGASTPRTTRERGRRTFTGRRRGYPSGAVVTCRGSWYWASRGSGIRFSTPPSSRKRWSAAAKSSTNAMIGCTRSLSEVSPDSSASLKDNSRSAGQEMPTSLALSYYGCSGGPGLTSRQRHFLDQTLIALQRYGDIRGELESAGQVVKDEWARLNYQFRGR